MNTTAGPTQGAERHAEKIDRWTARPGIALALRITIFLLPITVSILFTWSAGHILPPEEVGIGRWKWIGIVFVLANVLLHVLRKLAERLIPLVALMRLTLVFPDQAPSRTKATLRRSSSRKLLREIKEAEARGENSQEVLHGEYLVQLLAELNEHDRLTRGHSERVRVYSEMLGEELKLSEDEMNKLRWAALLHDVGKIAVPSEILNKAGRPTDEEWQVLASHPSAGTEFLAPLRPWLGDWVHAADQHHCRWDGKGYPEKLAGTEIALAGRLVAIADAYDVMTSSRSYKKPLSVELARQELTDCAGAQFDPHLVRLFLAISLGRLQSVGGPLAWLVNLTGSAQLPAPIAGTVASTAWSASAASAAAVVTAAAAIIAPQTALVPEPEPDLLAFSDPVVEVADVSISVPEDAGPSTISIHMTSTAGRPILSVTLPASGSAEVASQPAPVDSAEAWVAEVLYTPQSDFVGNDGFGYRACAESLCSSASVAIDVYDTNEEPTAASDTTSTPFETPVLVDVLANDQDPDASGPAAGVNTKDGLTIIAVGNGSIGTAQIVGDAIRYTPEPGMTGSDSFTYTIRDGDGAEATSTVSVEVAPRVWPAPIALDDSGTGFEGAEDQEFVTADVTTNDTTGDGASGPDPTVWVVEQPDKGTAVSNGDGTFTYSPNPDSFGTDSFRYAISDSHGLEATATVTLEIAAVNDAPFAEQDSGSEFSTTEDQVLRSGNVLANDTDPDHDLTGSNLVLVTDPTSGTVVLNGDGTFDYTPAPDFYGSDSFAYRLIDDLGAASNDALVTITIDPVGDRPVAIDDTVTAREDEPVTILDLTDNDTDVDHGDIDRVGDGGHSGLIGRAVGVVTIVNDVRFGTLRAAGEQRFDYTPNLNFYGTDQFTYTLTDEDGLVSEPATVTITVASINDRPIAFDNDYTVAEGVELGIDDLVDDDQDVEDDALFIANVTIIDAPISGHVTIGNDGHMTYLGDEGFYGLDSFTYTVKDSAGAASEPATVLIRVTEAKGRPVANPDSGTEFSTREDTVLVTGDVTANDTDTHDDAADPASVVVVEQPSRGELSFNGDGTFTYEPEPDFYGTLTFAYTVSDSRGLESEPAQVTITVTPVNDAPVATPDLGPGYSTAEDTPLTTLDVTANDGDIEDRTVSASTVVVEDAPEHGDLVHNGDGTFTYTPDTNFSGSDSFTYTVADSEGLRSEQALVSLRVGPANNRPVANDDSGPGLGTTEDHPFTTTDVTANDSDLEDGAIDHSHVTVTTPPSFGSVVYNDNGTFTYRPDDDYFGMDQFGYTVTDSKGYQSNEATVTIVVSAANDVPVAVDDGGLEFSTDEDTAFTTASVLANDSDIEDGTIAASAISVLTNPTSGTVVDNEDGSFDYAPDPDFFGIDTFTYRVIDSDGSVSNPATVTITVEPVNDRPMALPDAFSTDEDRPIFGLVLVNNDSDIEDGDLDQHTVTIVDLPAVGDTTQAPDGSIGYVPPPNWSGVAQFTYTVTDSRGAASDVTEVTITVEEINDAPVAANDKGIGFGTAEDTPLVTASILLNDSDVEDESFDPAHITVVSGFSNGTITWVGHGRISYVPDANFAGSDTLVYTVSDSAGADSGEATVSIQVLPVNDSPVAADDSYVIAEDISTTIGNVAANDSDPEDSAIDGSTIAVLRGPTHGTLLSHGDGTFVYSPDNNYNGTDSFTYVFTDSDGALSNAATVAIEITAVNDPPVEADDSGASFTFPKDVPFTANGYNDEDGPDTQAMSTSKPARRWFADTQQRRDLRYTPNQNFNGTDSLAHRDSAIQQPAIAPTRMTHLAKWSAVAAGPARAKLARGRVVAVWPSSLLVAETVVEVDVADRNE